MTAVDPPSVKRVAAVKSRSKDKKKISDKVPEAITTLPQPTEIPAALEEAFGFEEISEIDRRLNALQGFLKQAKEQKTTGKTLAL
jgi:hypothetical protein